jgi:hypothetical protein
VEIIYRPSRHWLLLNLAALVGSVVAGCSGAKTLYTVQGTVYLDGEPAKELAGGTVTYNSTELHKSASGAIQADGTYRLSEGAIAGTYQVSVSPPETSSAGERGKSRASTKPAPFEPPKDLQATVERKTNDIPIRLKRIKSKTG